MLESESFDFYSRRKRKKKQGELKSFYTGKHIVPSRPIILAGKNDWLYGISTFVGYLMPYPWVQFQCKKSLTIVILQF